MFTADRFGKSAARFDMKKIQWLNGQHIRRLSVEALLARVLPLIHAAGFETSGKDDAWLLRMAAICQEKLATLNDIVAYTDFFFTAITEYEEKAVKKQFDKEDAADKLAAIREVIESAEPWSAETLHGRFEAMAEAASVGVGQFIHPARLALTGKSIGPGLYELAELLGREECLARIEKAIAFVNTLNTESAS